jgi:phosphoribosylamine--glycine ligase
MRVLVIGSGGREHALAWKLAQSPHCENLYVAPGNDGMEQLASRTSIDPMDFEAIGDFARDNSVELIVVGPEAPLAAGLADYIRERQDLGLTRILGPDREAARLESSKAFAKAFMQEQQIPTAAFQVFNQDEYAKARAYLEGHALPLVVKADGLAAGKGVYVCRSYEEAQQALRACFEEKRFGQAGQTVVVERYLPGRELSVFVLTDGERYLLLPSATDYKRVGEGDKGPNTGGMGAVSPAPLMHPALEQSLRERIVEPTLEGLRKRGLAYRGFLFLGLMLVEDVPYLVEYNVRLGDPETQAILPRIEEDLLPQLDQAAQGKLYTPALALSEEPSAAVVLASEGYPGAYSQDRPISGLETLSGEAMVFHAGIRREAGGQWLTAGGRVLSIAIRAGSSEEALQKAYQNIERIHFQGMHYRRDIGAPFVAPESAES